MSKNVFNDILFKDWPRKLAAILLACLIYAVVRVQLQDDRTFDNVKISVVAEDSKHVVLNGENLFASITISGTRRNLGKLKSNQQLEIINKVQVGTRPGVLTFVLETDDLKLPNGVTITDVNFTPSQISVIIDQVIEKKVTVRSRVDYDSVPDGWEIKDRDVKPREVLVKGPKSLVEALDRVETTELIIPKKASSEKIREEVRLALPLGIESITPSTVEMSVQLTQNLSLITLKEIDVQVLQKDGSSCKVSKFIDKPEVTIVIKGEQGEIDFLQRVHVKAFIEIDEAVIGETMRPIRVWLDRRNRESCRITSQNPKDITVIVEKVP